MKNGLTRIDNNKGHALTAHCATVNFGAAPFVGDYRQMKKFLLLLSILLTSCAGAQTITVNWGTVYQTIDGFGASSLSTQVTLTSNQTDFFYTKSGANIGLTVIRVRAHPDYADCVANEDPRPCVNVANATISGYDLANARAAHARGAKVWAVSYSPPGSMKSNGSYLTGGAMIGNRSNYTTLAAIQASFVTLLTGTFGIPIYALSIQNEPDISAGYPSCTWTPTQIHDYIPYLASALSDAGYGSTKIMAAEQSTWGNSYNAPAMNDASVAANIGILAAHNYGGSPSLLQWNNFTTQRVWQTEVSDSNTYDGSITSGLTYATQIYNFLTTAKVNLWSFWELTGYGYPDNEGLTDENLVPAKRAYTIGNYAKFIRPGWHMVGVANSTGLLVTAAQSPNGRRSAIVVVNNSSSAVANQRFSVGESMGSVVTPWITSSSLSLEAQSPVAVSGGLFTYTIPADSVVSFDGRTR